MTFFQDAKSFSLSGFSSGSKDFPHKGLWLALIGTNEIPPHAALINEGKYYSLSVNKVDTGSPAEKLLNVLTHKNIPALFIRIETKDTGANVTMQLHSIFKEFHPLANTENTCLSPITDFFTIFYSLEFSSIHFVFDLLALAYKKKLIKECVAFPQYSNSNIITLPKYTMHQIRNKIHALSSLTKPIK